MAKKITKKIINKKKIIISIIIVLVVISILILSIKMLNKLGKKEKTKEIEVIDKIDKYDYVLEDNKSKYYNELFKELKEIVKEEPVNEENYAKAVSKIFISDLYDLNSKVMKSDIGGVQYVYSPFKEDFKKTVQGGMYATIESNVYGDRKQNLPKVKNVDVIKISTNTFKYNENSDENAFYIDLKITYEADLGYQETVSIVLIHDSDKLEVASLENS